MREHESDPALPERCKHCGGKMAILGKDASCLDRPDESPPRRIPKSGLNDFDAIFDRLAELRKEREAIEAATAAVNVPLADGMYDGDCG
jgi:hypothetical protein